jgi:hypothetical protein
MPLKFDRWPAITPASDLISKSFSDSTKSMDMVEADLLNAQFYT